MVSNVPYVRPGRAQLRPYAFSQKYHGHYYMSESWSVSNNSKTKSQANTVLTVFRIRLPKELDAIH